MAPHALRSQDSHPTQDDSENAIRKLEKQHQKLESQISGVRKELTKLCKKPQATLQYQALVTGHEANLTNWTACQSQIRAEIMALRPPPPTDRTPTPLSRNLQPATPEEVEEEDSISGSQRRPPEEEQPEEEEEDLYGDPPNQQHQQPNNPRKRRAPDSPQRIQMPRDEFLRMQNRLDALEREQARRTPSVSSRRSLSTPSLW